MTAMEALMDRWMLRNEAAQYLKISTRQFDRLVSKGKINKYTAAGYRSPRFDREELDRFMRGQKP